MPLLVIFVVLVFLYSLISRRLARTIVTAPMVFTVAGILALTILPAVMMTVLLSIFAHGVSAAPGLEIYARRIAALGADSPEREGPEGSPPPAAAIA